MAGKRSVEYEFSKARSVEKRGVPNLQSGTPGMKSIIYTFCGILGAVTCVCAAAPEPAVVPGPGLWTIDTTFTHPQQIVLRLGPDNQPKRFWYVLLTLTNKTDRDVDFYPKCDLMTDTFQITSAGKGVGSVVFEQIKKRHQSKYPFLETLEKVGNKILQGEDNAKDIAIIWPDFDPNAKSIKVFISGLSNETAAIDHPISKDKAGKALKVYLRKTLELSYGLTGEPATRSDANLAYAGKRWIMR